ncbi:MAG: TetR/AcrR family transcriptional regulator [Desulfobacterota bacterium]|nr:TetR/AcrR family transcriptional regulator [Thermodesulfobacteriota bacterium]
MAKANDRGGTLSRSALRRQREKEQRYKTVLRAAETLFARKGYHQTSIEEIADLAEVSTGAVYFYFKNKEDLLIKLMHEFGFFLREWLGKELEKNDPTLEGFSHIAESFLRDFCVSYPEKITIFFRESVGQSREVEEQRKDMFVRLTSDIRDVLVDIASRLSGRFVSDVAPEVVAVCIVGIYERLACHYVLWQDRAVDITDIVDETVSFTLGGVRSLLAPEKKKKG